MSHARKAGRGIALIAVLWLVAALAVGVHSLTASMRAEIRQTGDALVALQATAAADAAILLALQSMQQSRNTSASDIHRAVHQFGNFDVSVNVVPLNGWIDINHAPEPLFAALFQHGGGLPAEEAMRLAQAAIAYRASPGPTGRPIGFEAPEDLLAVPGVDIDLYVKIRGAVTADLPSGALVNPSAAPVDVLRVVSGGDEALVQQVLSRRQTAGASLDLTRFSPGLVAVVATNYVCLCAEVALPDGRVLQREWRVIAQADADTGLPWQLLGRGERLVASPPQ